MENPVGDGDCEGEVDAVVEIEDRIVEDGHCGREIKAENVETDAIEKGVEPPVENQVETAVEEAENEEDNQDYMYLDTLAGYNLDLCFTGLADVTNDVDDGIVVSAITDNVPSASEGSCSIPVANLGRGFRTAPDEDLVKAGEGNERLKSHKNDRWAVKRADQLRMILGWDMTKDLGDLSFTELDTLLNDLFTRVVKVNGEEYPSESLMNMLGGFNRVIRHASEVRAVKGLDNPLTKEFNINFHPCFPRTRLVLRAVVRKSAKNGNNKKRIKVGTLTLEMEIAIKLDIDHQISSSQGCQKRLALYLMLRLGIRGGLELWNLMRHDLKLMTGGDGREYISFEERESKNNSYDLDQTKEEQFRQTFVTYKEDFVLTFKQYLRHMAPVGEGVNLDLFMQPIQNPAGLVWYNKVTKVSERVCSQWLKNMMSIVGLPPELITSNKAGRVTLITRMAACGVPDAIGCLVTGHHTTDGYGRYDRTKDLKMEAAVLSGCTPGLTYESALTEVSKKFVQEKLIGSSVGLHPLMDKVTSEREEELRRKMRQELDASMAHVVTRESSGAPESLKNHLKHSMEPDLLEGRTGQERGVEVSPVFTQKLLAWHEDFDQIDWEVELDRNPTLAKALAKVSNSGRKINPRVDQSILDYDSINWDAEVANNPVLAKHLGNHAAPVQAFTGNSFSNLTNCTIQICVGASREKNDDNKENTPGAAAGNT